jgi:hypothetical protein
MRRFRVGTTMLFVAAAIISAVLFASCSGETPRITSYGIVAKNLVVSKIKDGPEVSPPVFSLGDTIFIRFEISEFVLDADGNMWVQEDLVMRDENNVSILTRPNLLNDRVPPPGGVTSAPIGNVITVFDTTTPGDYTIDLSVRDKIGGGAVYIEVPVTITAK